MIISLLTLVWSLLTSPSQIIAASPTPTPNESSPAILEEAQKIRQAVQEKVMEKIKDITDPESSKKGFIGTVTQINGNQISITHKSQNYTLTTDDSTTIIDEKRNKAKLEDIEVGQGILAMGYLTQQSILDAKRLIFVDLETLENEQQVVVGNIVDASQSSPVFVLIPSKNKDQQFQIKTDTKTAIVNQNGKKLTVDIQAGKKVICIIQPDPKMANTFYATKIIHLGTETTTPTPQQ